MRSIHLPISKASVGSKLLERHVARQLLPSTYSGFRRGQSTETPITHDLWELLEAVDRGDTAAVLTLLHLSAALDAVDHESSQERLRVSLGFDGRALSWFSTKP